MGSKKIEPFWERSQGPMHSFFGLSYANYLVLPRGLVQCMPIEWQENMVKLLSEYSEAFSHLKDSEPEGGYKIEPLKEASHYNYIYDDEDEDEEEEWSEPVVDINYKYGQYRHSPDYLKKD